MKYSINPTSLPMPKGSYSRCTRVGNIIFTAGIGPVNPTTGILSNGDIKEQTKLTIENIAITLEAAGATLDNIVHLMVFLRDFDDYEEFNQTFDEIFLPHIKNLPTRATVQAAALYNDIRIEIVAVAII